MRHWNVLSVMINPQPNPLIVVENVSRLYEDGQVLALDRVSLTVYEGDYVAIVGPSGSGKSTLLNVLGGLDYPTSGTVSFQGKELVPGPMVDELRAHHIGYIFQSFYLLPTLTSLENVQLPMFETGKNPKQRIERAKELLDVVGLSHRSGHLPSQLSVGERQRVAIARSLANSPEVLLADEPTGNLDSRTGEEILNLFRKLHEELKMTLVVITHSDDVAQRAQRIVEVRDGRIVRDDLNAVESVRTAEAK